MVDTLVPVVYKNGINLNVRYSDLIPGLVLRTDHNYSFWNDKNYNVYGLTSLVDFGLFSQADSAGYGDVDHLLLWNGIGAAFDLTSRLTIEFYARNLYRQDSAKAGGMEYKLSRNQIFVEPKLIYKFNSQVEVFAGLSWESTVTVASEALNKQGLNAFKPGAAIKETSDTVNVIRIPMGLTMSF
jgi:hypothetical protein